MSGKKGDGATETIIGRDSVAPNMEALSMRNTAFAAVLRAVGVRGGASGALKAAARLVREDVGVLSISFTFK